jgi:phosphoribosyl 1,2-cyclic phosphodiesterase
MSSMTVLCRGARGSVAVSGAQFQRYGGGTTCFEICLNEEHRLLIDAGTGALSINSEPMHSPATFSILLTHLHWDHTLALPFFAPLYNPSNRFDFYGHTAEGMLIEDAINAVMQPPWFPVSFRSSPSRKSFTYLDSEPVVIDDITVKHARLYHPQGVTGYRLERNGAVMAVCTDVEHGEAASDAAVRRLAEGADVLLYDAQYLPDQYLASKVGWGHSTWEEAVKVAADCGVGRLILTSHDPLRSDEDVDHILTLARERFPNTEAAAEGMKFDVG